ncbi:MAG TPA: caspase family protein [Polyangiaceae bacterium]|nr:caspase family protein [Polyangiaceae bacterium]
MLRVILAVAVLLTYSEQLVWAKPRTVERFALVIGNNLPLTANRPKLRYADDDAVATQLLLLEAGVDSVLLVSPDADTQRMFSHVHAFGPPNTEALERAYAGLSTRMRAAQARESEVEFLFFYSGHGDVDAGEGYLSLENARLTRSLLFSLLLRSPATRNHVFIDACKSYYVAFDRGPGGERETYTGSQLVQAVPSKLDNTGFVLSTSSDRDSHEWQRFQGGVLSHELRSALRGAADTNLDRQISYAEIGAFLRSANESIPNPGFRPDFLVRAPAGNLRQAVLSWNPTHAVVSVHAGTWGHFYVETARGDRLLDAHPAATQALLLWLPSERPLFIRQYDGRAESVISGARSVELAAFETNEPELASRGALSLALDRLFEQPFDEGDVQRFERKPPVNEMAAPDKVEPRAEHSVLRRASGTVALVAAGAGLTLSGFALVNHARTADESQVRIQELNERVETLNRASLACYGVAALSGVVWLLAGLPPSATVAVNPAGNEPRLSAVSFTFSGQF